MDGSPKTTDIEHEWLAVAAKQRRDTREAMMAGAAAIAADDPRALRAAINALNGCGALDRAFAKCAQGSAAGPNVQADMLQGWLDAGDSLRSMVNHDLRLLDGLRTLLPPYQGAELILYRGDSARNRSRRTYGFSWTFSVDVARSFALGGWQTFRGGSVLLRATVPATAVICAPGLHDDRYGEAEYLVDRRLLKSVTVIERFEQRPMAAHQVV